MLAPRRVGRAIARGTKKIYHGLRKRLAPQPQLQPVAVKNSPGVDTVRRGIVVGGALLIAEAVVGCGKKGSALSQAERDLLETTAKKKDLEDLKKTCSGKKPQKVEAPKKPPPPNTEVVVSGCLLTPESAKVGAEDIEVEATVVLTRNGKVIKKETKFPESLGISLGRGIKIKPNSAKVTAKGKLTFTIQKIDDDKDIAGWKDLSVTFGKETHSAKKIFEVKKKTKVRRYYHKKKKDGGFKYKGDPNNPLGG
jgi:hypothetical protein